VFPDHSYQGCLTAVPKQNVEECQTQKCGELFRGQGTAGWMPKWLQSKMQITCWLLPRRDFSFGASPATTSLECHCSEGLSILNPLIKTRIPPPGYIAPSSSKKQIIEIWMEEIVRPTPSVTRDWRQKERMECFFSYMHVNLCSPQRDTCRQRLIEGTVKNIQK